MDGIGLLVSYPNLAAVGPEESRHYSWSFNRVHGRIRRKQCRDVCDRSISVNSKDVAFVARDNHVKAKCANVVERNSVVIRCDAPREGRKQCGNT